MVLKFGGLVGAAAATLLALQGPANSQAYPSQPITMTLPFAPGGSADLSVRIVSEKISAKLGQPVVIENRPGAGASLPHRLWCEPRPTATSCSRRRMVLWS